jgi:hypothetical protein
VSLRTAPVANDVVHVVYHVLLAGLQVSDVALQDLTLSSDCFDPIVSLFRKPPQKSGWFSSRMPRRAPALLNGQIGWIADLHAQHPKGEAHGCTE